MKQHGRTPWRERTSWREMGTGPAARALADNQRILTEACKLLTALWRRPSHRPGGGNAARQLLPDQEQIRTGPAAPARGLQPGVASPEPWPIVGFRACTTSRSETISPGLDGWDPEGLTGFVAAYQTVTALKLGELWPFPHVCAWLSSRTCGVWVRGSPPRGARARPSGVWAEQMAAVAKKDRRA